jgi:hypothetical protein
LDLSPAQHWYPLGYALLATPFYPLMPVHPFFPVNLIAFMLMGALTVALGRQFGIVGLWGAGSFFVGAVLPGFVLMQYIVPWNTIPVAALYVTILVIYARAVKKGVTAGRLAAIGAAGALILITRPIDAFAMWGVAFHLLYRLSRQTLSGEGKTNFVFPLIAAITSIAAVLVPYIGLHIAVYGVHPSAYMVNAGDLGFDLQSIPFKFAMIFGNPRDFFPQAIGIFERYPLILLGMVSLVYAALFLRELWAVPAAALSSIALYLSYVDFLPTNVWTYMLLHYIVWTFPVMALTTLAMVRDLASALQLNRLATAAGLLLLLSLIGVRSSELPQVAAIDSNSSSVRAFRLPDRRAIAAIQFTGMDDERGGIQLIEQGMTLDGVPARHLRDFKVVPSEGVITAVFTKPRQLTEIAILDASADESSLPSKAKFLLADWRVGLSPNLLASSASFDAAAPIFSRPSESKCPGEVERSSVYPTRDSDFIRYAYATLLGRQPDPKGFADGCRLLGTGELGRDAYIQAIMNSAEYKGRRS